MKDGVRIRIMKGPRRPGRGKRALAGLMGLALMGFTFLPSVQNAVRSLGGLRVQDGIYETLPDGDYLQIHALKDEGKAKEYAKEIEDDLTSIDCDSCEPALEWTNKDGQDLVRVTIKHDDEDFDEAFAYATTKSDNPHLLMKRGGEDRFKMLEEEVAKTMEKLDILQAERGAFTFNPEDFVRGNYRLTNNPEGIEVSNGYDPRFKTFIEPTLEAIGRYGLQRYCDPQFLVDFAYATVWGESTFDPGAIGKAGEIGATQIFPSTGWDIDRRMRRAGLERTAHEVDDYMTILLNVDEHMDRFMWSAGDGFRRWTEKLGKPCTDRRVVELVSAEHNEGITGAKKYETMTRSTYYMNRGYARIAAVNQELGYTGP